MMMPFANIRNNGRGQRRWISRDQFVTIKGEASLRHENKISGN